VLERIAEFDLVVVAGALVVVMVEVVVEAVVVLEAVLAPELDACQGRGVRRAESQTNGLGGCDIRCGAGCDEAGCCVFAEDGDV